MAKFHLACETVQRSPLLPRSEAHGNAVVYICRWSKGPIKVVSRLCSEAGRNWCLRRESIRLVETFSTATMDVMSLPPSASNISQTALRPVRWVKADGALADSPYFVPKFDRPRFERLV